MRPPTLTPLGYLILALAATFAAHGLLALVGVDRPVVSGIATVAVWGVLFLWARVEQDPGRSRRRDS